MKKKTSKTVFVNITIGFQLGITVAILTIGGHFADGKFDSSPLFLVLGAVVGLIIGFYHLIKELDALKKQEAKNKEDNEENRSKVRWM